MSGSIFARVEALEALARELPALVDMRARVERAEAVIAAQADLIRALVDRLPLDEDMQRALAGVEVAAEPAALPLALPEAAAMVEAVAPVLQAHGVTLAELRGPRRVQRLVQARWAASALLVGLGHPRERIARFLRRDVSTVAHGLRQRGAG